MSGFLKGVVAGGAIAALGLHLLWKKKTSKPGKIVVGYWAIRGLAAPLRMILSFVDAEWENVMYDVEPKEGGGWDLSQWLGVKPSLQKLNPLMNLPYVKHGDVVVTQSNACLTYLGRVFDLNGQTDEEVARCEQVMCQVMDLRNDAVKLFYGTFKEEGAMDRHLAKTVPTHYKKLEGWLKLHGTPFMAGDAPTVCDFHCFEMIDQHELLCKSRNVASPLSSCELLLAYYRRFTSLPRMQKYLASDLHCKTPCNNRMAGWIGAELKA